MAKRIGTRPGTILHLPRRQFSKFDSTLEHGKSQFGVIIDMDKRFRLGIKLLGNFGPKGVESAQDLADYANRKLKGDYYNKNHMGHMLRQLVKAAVVLPPSATRGWRLSPNGEAIYARTKLVPLNQP